MAEKSEKATPKKVRDARKKGQVAKSQDFPAAFTFIVSFAGVVIIARYVYQTLAQYMVSIFTAIQGDIDMQNRAGGYLLVAFQTIFNASVPLMIIVTLVGILVGFLIVGPLFSFEAMKPDIKRLNPVDNLKNIFKLKTFVELVKSVLKITIAIILIYTVVRNSVPAIVATVNTSVMGATVVFSDFLVQVAIRVGIFFIAVAIFDLVFQKRNFAKEMMMEKFEVKQEMKDTEGDPHIKGRRRQMAQEIAYQEGPAAVRRARTVITNPTHIAVALEYDPQEAPAPKIVTMGKGVMAEEIIRRAMEYNKPIMRNVALAHELYETGHIGHFIPEATYAAVAEILKWVAELEHAQEIEKPEFLK